MDRKRVTTTPPVQELSWVEGSWNPELGAPLLHPMADHCTRAERPVVQPTCEAKPKESLWGLLLGALKWPELKESAALHA